MNPIVKLINHPLFDQIVKKHIDIHGDAHFNRLLDQMTEEAAELIVARCHYERDRTSHRALLREMVDLVILLGAYMHSDSCTQTVFEEEFDAAIRKVIAAQEMLQPHDVENDRSARQARRSSGDQKYVRADEFFRNAKKTSIAEDVKAETIQEQNKILVTPPADWEADNQEGCNDG